MIANASINTDYEYYNVKYICPKCKKIKSLKTLISPIKGAVKNGITAIEIKEGLICPHNFIAEIGRDFMQRSSYTIDFTIPKENSTLNKKIKLSTLIPRLNSMNFKKILIKKAHEIINLIVKLGFTQKAKESPFL